MFEKAQKVKRWFKVALWGDKKSGKTKFSLSFPGCCVIDTERGSLLFSDEFEFDVKDANRWKEVGTVLDWLDGNPGKYQTLVIDSLTVFYQDLIEDVTSYVKNKRGNEVLTYLDWSVIKRRWKAFMNRLIDLEMNVVLVMREKDIWETSKDHHGQEITRKTGEHAPDAEKSVGYIFDFIVHLHTEEDKKAKKARYLATVDGTRREKEIPRYKTYDLTGKRGYDTVFKPLEDFLLAGIQMPRRKTEADEPSVLIGTSEEADKSTSARVGEMLDKFSNPGDPDAPMATAEDIKVLMTRAGQMLWPDGSKFTSQDGKTLIRALFKVDSSKDMKKYQADFLFDEFGKVLAGKAGLGRDETGVPYVSGATIQEPSF